MRAQNERTLDARLPPGPTPEAQRIPEASSPCARIGRVVLAGERSASFLWAVADLSGPDGNDAPIGRCLDAAGVEVVRARAQQAVIARGWVTTRVLAAPQDLAAGTLTLTLIPGRIAAIRLTPKSSAALQGSSALLATAIPAAPGDLLDLRDIEQGLENLKRVPTAEADIQFEAPLAPDARPGDSDLMVTYAQARKLRATLSLDDSGTQATGRYQAGGTLSVDNPLGLNDLFYVSANHSINGHAFGDPRKSTEGQTAHYSLPYGYWLLVFTASHGSYLQTVAGAFQDNVYSGNSDTAEIKLSRLVYRDRSRKTTVALKAFRRESRSWFEDAEIPVQHHVAGGWEASLNHREFIGEATLDGTLATRRGTGAFGAMPHPGEPYGEGTSRMKLHTAELGVNAPFRLDMGDSARKFRYSGLLRAQWNRTPLTPQDRMAIGGRFTVRGFDGQTSLLGDRGWLVRNDIGWAVGASGAEFYAGADYGHVGGRSAADLLGRHLAGAVIGVRGSRGMLGYDLFVGVPLARPEGYRTARVTAGFHLHSTF